MAANETADPDDTQQLMERLETMTNLPMENENTIPRSNIHRSVPSVSELFGSGVQDNYSSSQQLIQSPDFLKETHNFHDTGSRVSYERGYLADSSRTNDFYTYAKACTRTAEHRSLDGSVTQLNPLSSNGESDRLAHLSVPNLDASKLYRPRDHHRNVSWGNDLGLNALSGAEQSRNLPVRTEDNSLDSYPMMKDNPITHVSHRPTKSLISLGEATSFSLLTSSPHPRTVVLEDVSKCNPLETEAEVLIMRVLENQESENRANTETLPFLANSPSGTDLLQGSTAEPYQEYTDDESGTDLELQPFLNDNARPTKRPHERQNTLESLLMDLTEDLNELHGTTSDSDQDHKILPSDASAGATLAENANKIFRRTMRADRATGDSFSVSSDSESRHSEQIARKVAVGAADNGDLDLSHVDEGCDEEEAGSHHESQAHTGQPGLKDPSYASRLRAVVHRWLAKTKILDFATVLSAQSNLMRYYTWAYASVVIPLIGIAFTLFYLADNPPTGILTYNTTSAIDPIANATVMVNTKGEHFESQTASASWWLLFIVRQVTMLTVALQMQLIVVDFFCFSTKVAEYFGQIGLSVALFVAQSKGWPFVVFFWGILNFSFLSGKTPWAEHWAYWQDCIGLFNYQNPSGSVPSSGLYIRILSIAVAITLIVSIKRFWLGLVWGRKTFRFYAEDLAKVTKKILLLTKVANMTRDVTLDNACRRPSRRKSLINFEKYSHLVDDINELDLDDSTKVSMKSKNKGDGESMGTFSSRRVLSHEEKTRLNKLVGVWEEPEKEVGNGESVPISAIIQFRKSLQAIDKPLMFGNAFGDTSSRERMVANAHILFQKLSRLGDNEDNTSEISFNALALAAVDKYGDMNEVDLKDLIRLLRPDRSGKIQLKEFVKSIDAAYKEGAQLRVSVNNCEKIDKAFENVIDVVFYVIALCIILNQLGLSPLALFLSLSSFVLAFAFMIGSASSRMFEGWLMVLLQRPYDIGDRIHVSNVQSDSNLEGSFGWIVTDVTLYTTTVIFQPNNERATISNGSMASSRIINAARSPMAVVFINLKFSTSVPYERLKVFEDALRIFIKDRPNEWASFITFRVLKIHVEQGYIEYITILQHRLAWQEIFTIQESRSVVAAFCHELSKKMGMHYKSPPLPVSLAIVKSDPEMPMGEDSLYSEIVSANALFERVNNSDVAKSAKVAMGC